MNKKLLLVVLLITWLTLLSSCAPLPNTDHGSTAIPSENLSSSNVPEILTVYVGSEPEQGFDPIKGWGRYGYPLFQSTLLKYDENLNLSVDLAEKYVLSQGGLVWVVKIREDAFFSNGDPVTADDVVFTYTTAKENSSTVDLTMLESVDALDDHVVQFKLREPDIYFIYRLATLGIVPQRLYSDRYAYNPIGSGPYKLDQYVVGERTVISRNPYYYGEKPQFEVLILQFLDETAAPLMAKSGQFHIVAVPPSAIQSGVPDGMRVIAVDSVDNRGIVLPFTPPMIPTGFDYEIGNAVTSHPEIRQALNIGLDRQEIVDTVLFGYGSPAYTVTYRLPWDIEEPYQTQDGDIQQARHVLEQNGWAIGPDGIYIKDGVRASFNLIYPAGDSVRQAIAMLVQKQAKQLGIDISLQSQSWDEIAKNMYTNPVIMGWGSLDPVEFYNLHSGQYRGRGWYNVNFYQNQAVDALFEQARRQTDYNNAIAQWREAQHLIYQDLPWVWLVNLKHVFLVDRCLDLGQPMVQPHAHGWSLLNNIQEWKWVCP